MVQKHGSLLILVYLVERLYLGINIHGRKPSQRLTRDLWFSDSGKGSWNCDVHVCERQRLGPKLAIGRFVNGSYYNTQPGTNN